MSSSAFPETVTGARLGESSGSNSSIFRTPEESSSSECSAAGQAAASSSSSSGGGDSEKPKSRGRKGHTKSRRGCFNCKRARIKCKENKPACDYCAHRGLRCEWPDLQVNMMGGSQDEPVVPVAYAQPLTTVSPQSQGPVFTMQDFRLFNHFIQTAYPHHPVRNDSVWTHEIPSLSSDYDFLLHSMLALAASDLANSRDASLYRDEEHRAQLNHTALTYRVKAITSLNQAINAPIQSFQQGNAMLATCFSLLFQSVLMDDGLIEYMTFIRGVVAVGIHMGVNNLRFLFERLFDQTEMIQAGLQSSPLVDPELAKGACRSVEKFAHLVTNPRELEYLTYLLGAARDLFTSSSEAYGNLAKIYGLFCYHMSHPEFALFVSPTNEAGKLLQSHFAALQIIMTPITLSEAAGGREEQGGGSGTTGPGRGTTARWLKHLHKNIHPEMKMYYEWPIMIEQGVADGWVPLKFEQ
ncbi:hypothetical protein B0O99DRAFT_641090 [Bisporella sp. PMI_857]|nr:hypothetical protein B0O99DRAFT_641090 [Bisporella sp. PMI_857]